MSPWSDSDDHKIIQLLHYGGWQSDPRRRSLEDKKHRTIIRVILINLWTDNTLALAWTCQWPSQPLPPVTRLQPTRRKLKTPNKLSQKKAGLHKKTFHHWEEIASYTISHYRVGLSSPSAWLALANKSLLRDNNWLRTLRNRTRGAGNKNPSNTQPANHCR